MKELTLVFLGFIIGAIFIDQASFRYCATFGEVRMIGGGTITCAVKKEAL